MLDAVELRWVNKQIGGNFWFSILVVESSVAKVDSRTDSLTALVHASASPPAITASIR